MLKIYVDKDQYENAVNNCVFAQLCCSMRAQFNYQHPIEVDESDVSILHGSAEVYTYNKYK